MLLQLCAAAQQDKDKFNPIPVALPIISIAPDARAAGMGDMGVATTPDVHSQHYNAAKYAFAESRLGIGVSVTPWLANLVQDVNITYGSFFYRIGSTQSVGMSVRYFSLGKMEIMSNQGHFVDVVNPNEFSIDLSYARRFGRHLSAALTGRYIRSDLTGGLKNTESGGGDNFISPANAGSFDMAVYYQNTHEDNDYGWGVTITNLGTKVAYAKENTDRYFLPATIHLGGRYTFNVDADNSFLTGLELSKLLVPTPPVRDSGRIALGYNNEVGAMEGLFQSFYDAPYGWKEELSEIMVGVGAEYIYRKLFFARAGYFHDSKRKGNRRYITFGAGIKYNFIELNVSYLFPFTTTDPLSNTLRVSLLFDFNTLRLPSAY
ncbi:MAG: type IX secretion system outer membrane channel protein PorV [Prevotellaceae bacterium]|nr:type IX secretion system outer membrane channel protein PorV [Prevotellaceae bacterium]